MNLAARATYTNTRENRPGVVTRKQYLRGSILLWVRGKAVQKLEEAFFTRPRDGLGAIAHL